jgi:hypothetical protein
VSARFPYLAFAACLGVALALVGYRFAMMPLGWTGPVHAVFEYGAPGAAIGGWIAVRGQPGPWPRLAMVLAFVAGAVLAFAAAYVLVPSPARAHLTTRELPGFSIDLPPGDTKRENLDYATGSLEIVDVGGGGGVFGVTWQAGQPTSRDELATAAKALLGIVGAASDRIERMSGPGGKPIDVVALSTGKGTMWAGLVPCGGRELFVVAAGNGSESLFERVLPTIACHPDPAREATLGDLPLAIDMPAGWTKTLDASGAQQLTDGARLVLIKTIAAVPADADLPKVFQPLFAAFGLTATIGDKRGDLFPFDGHASADRVSGFFMPVTCERGSVIVLGFANDQASADELAALVRAKRRCTPVRATAP